MRSKLVVLAALALAAGCTFDRSGLGAPHWSAPPDGSGPDRAGDHEPGDAPLADAAPGEEATPMPDLAVPDQPGWRSSR